MGPTASGKSDLAIDLARQFGTEIVSVDSALVYRGMDIGTAKPSQTIRATIAHHLIDICDPSEVYSAANFRENAVKLIEKLHKKDKVPLFVGGTMLYFKALQYGLSDLPGANEAVREQLEIEAESLGWASLHQRLAKVDPETASRVHQNDPQRIQRALEVYMISGKPLSTLINEGKVTESGYDFIKLVVSPKDRSKLHERIAMRFCHMMDQGFLHEVEALFNRGDLYSKLPSMRAVGYRQLWQFLEGKIGYEEAVQKSINATRQLAKRQMTWLRAETACQWFDSLDQQVLNNILKYLGNGPIKG